MIFTKRLRDGVRQGEITSSIRIWQRPHVTPGRRYRMEEGEIEVDSILPINLTDITPELARESGFKGVVDLLKVAKHGPGENVYLVRFHYIRPTGAAKDTLPVPHGKARPRSTKRRLTNEGERTVLSNKELKLTKPANFGASQLNSSVRPTTREVARFRGRQF